MRIKKITLALTLGLSVSPFAHGNDTVRAQGKAVYDHWCTPCHAPSLLKPGTSALQVKYAGTPAAALEEREDMTPEFVSLMVRQGISIMPFFRHTEISDTELEALSFYLTDK